MLKSLMEEVDNMQGQTDNVRREKKTLRKRQNDMLESTLKNAFDGYISRLDMAEEIIIKLEDMSTEIS